MAGDPTMAAMCAQLQTLIDQVDESRLKPTQPPVGSTAKAPAPKAEPQGNTGRQAVAEIEAWYVKISREISECDQQRSPNAAQCRELRRRFEAEYPRMMARAPKGYELPSYASLASRYDGDASSGPSTIQGGGTVKPAQSAPRQAALPGAQTGGRAQHINPQTGEPCVTAGRLEERWETTLPGPGCLRKNEHGSCFDRLIRIELRNGCSGSYYISWQFEGAGRRCGGGEILGSGRASTVTCLQGEYGANGKLSYEFKPY